MRILALLALVACEKPQPEPPPLPPPPPSPVPVPVPPTIVDEHLACRADTDCEIFTSCCAHCNPGSTVVSVPTKFREIGELLTLTFYCPMCAEGGCTIPVPLREPICKAGSCARRDTTFTDWQRTTVKSIAEIETDPADIERGFAAVVGLAVAFRMCERAKACGGQLPICGMLLVEPPEVYRKPAAACLDAVAQVPCTAAHKLDREPPAACKPFVR